MFETIFCKILNGDIPTFSFKDCSMIESIILPNNVKTIKERAFENCRGLKEITLPETLKLIEIFAFSYCNDSLLITFEDPYNWYYTTNRYYNENGKPVDLTIPANNFSLMTYKILDVYTGLRFYKNMI